MKNLLRIEELAQLLVAIALLIDLQASWYWYLALALAPDVGMLGYLAGPKVGAWCYNALHHKAVTIIVCSAGFITASDPILFAGIAMFGHASLDRVFGYGLKYSDHFKHTHLGTIGVVEA